MMYGGLTSDLWMVTKGKLPGGIPRGGQRYGRPKHAGETRKRINVEIGRARGQSLEVTHWLKQITLPDGQDGKSHLRQAEEA